MFFKKFWPTIVSVGTLVAGVLSPSFQGVIAAHPTVSAVVAGVWAVLSHLLPSPVASDGK